MLLETFYEDWTKILCTKGTQKDSNALRLMGGNSCYLIFAYLDFTKYNEIYIPF